MNPLDCIPECKPQIDPEHSSYLAGSYRCRWVQADLSVRLPTVALGTITMTFATSGLVAKISRRSRLWVALCPLLCEKGSGPLQLGQKQQQRLLSAAAEVEGNKIGRQHDIEQSRLRCSAMSRQSRTD